MAENHNTGFTVFRDDLPLRVTAYSDSNYATNIDDRKCVSGTFLFVGRTPVVFGTSRQTTLATSSAEAELTALSTTCFAVQEPRDLLEPMGLLASGPSRVYCDSEAAIAAVMGGSRQLVCGLAKHHAVRLLKLRELIEDGLIDLQPINTTDNIADIFTKANPAPVLRGHLAAMHAARCGACPTPAASTRRQDDVHASDAVRRSPSVFEPRRRGCIGVFQYGGTLVIFPDGRVLRHKLYYVTTTSRSGFAV